MLFFGFINFAKKFCEQIRMETKTIRTKVLREILRKYAK